MPLRYGGLVGMTGWVLGMTGVLLGGAPPALGQSPLRHAGQAALTPSVGFGKDVHYGLDLAVRITPHVRVVASGYRWDGLELLCASYCAPQKTGWSLGGGARLELSSARSRWWPFLHVEAGLHWLDGSAPGFPEPKGFLGGRGGIAVTLANRVEGEAGIRLQHVPSYRFDTTTLQGPRTMETRDTNHVALTLGLALVLF